LKDIGRRSRMPATDAAQLTVTAPTEPKIVMTKGMALSFNRLAEYLRTAERLAS
jgi:hypothetical protein